MCLLIAAAITLLLATSARSQPGSGSAMEHVVRSAFTKAAQQPDSGMAMAGKAILSTDRK